MKVGQCLTPNCGQKVLEDSCWCSECRRKELSKFVAFTPPPVPKHLDLSKTAQRTSTRRKRTATSKKNTVCWMQAKRRLENRSPKSTILRHTWQNTPNTVVIPIEVINRNDNISVHPRHRRTNNSPDSTLIRQSQTRTSTLPVLDDVAGIDRRNKQNCLFGVDDQTRSTSISTRSITKRLFNSNSV